MIAAIAAIAITALAACLVFPILLRRNDAAWDAWIEASALSPANRRKKVRSVT